MPDLFVIDERGIRDQIGVTKRDLQVRDVRNLEEYLTSLERAGYEPWRHPAWPSETLQRQWWPLAMTG